ncbi:MAG TPA: Tfx family DNA-binding protein [Methanothermococcus okinawensis]|uniref:Tfx family DNA-binding protein n=1 Tax=Methanothermococcus okinawensis TaxID=155863 RepID=A0A833E476_9EURY|nr:Tfx family DNA-binding protein [Methanococcaceae archaeon]HIP84613.1 Tfx family DNA-binding protein [Methanothermococcus okinawensis]HIP91477.1 Tfx family DNA-binding protein [Methanothermococcus okinawensis]
MESFLTETQIKVLKLRRKGLTLEEIAHLMNTTKANICMIEKRARENIEKARNTLKIYESIMAPLRFTVKEGMDVFQIPKMLYRECNKLDIHVKYNSLELIDLIYKNMRDKIERRIVKKPFVISVSEEGDVFFLEWETLEDN